MEVLILILFRIIVNDNLELLAAQLLRVKEELIVISVASIVSLAFSDSIEVSVRNNGETISSPNRSTIRS